jgi:hypothetical protein
MRSLIEIQYVASGLRELLKLYTGRRKLLASQPVDGITGVKGYGCNRGKMGSTVG